jgi:hypothetical protein
MPAARKNVAARRFPAAVLDALDRAKILGVRSGTEHRYTGVWPVVIDGRLFVRSWSDKPTGWFRAFRVEPRGTISVDDRDIAVVGKVVGSAATRAAVTRAFAAKYDTRASEKWVRGFAEPAREANTLELIPA